MRILGLEYLTVDIEIVTGARDCLGSVVHGTALRGQKQGALPRTQGKRGRDYVMFHGTVLSFFSTTLSFRKTW